MARIATVIEVGTAETVAVLDGDAVGHEVELYPRVRFRPVRPEILDGRD